MKIARNVDFSTIPDYHEAEKEGFAPGTSSPFTPRQLLRAFALAASLFESLP